MNNSVKDMPAGAINGNVVYENGNIVVIIGKPTMAVDSDGANTARDFGKELNYESVWLDGTAAGSLKIYNPNAGKFGITLKMESSDSEAFAFCTVIKPNGQSQVGADSINLTPAMNDGEGWYKNFSNGIVGTYSIEYLAHANAGMRIMCFVD